MAIVISLFIGAVVGFMIGFLCYRKNQERFNKIEDGLK